MDLPSSPNLPSTRLRMVVGLGNPGKEYENTRHNIGFMAIDALIRKHALPTPTLTSAWHAAWTKDPDGCLYIKPTTYMNRSGFAVQAVAKFYKIPVHNILVVYDDLNLPLGRLRLRMGGSSGGQNGMRSIIEHFDTEEIPRLRIGIGSAEWGATDHVLGRFRSEEKPIVISALQSAIDAIDCAKSQGLAAAMNTFNRTSEEN